jgi:hypothetical protein
MTVLDHTRRARAEYAPRLHRRHSIVTTGGMDGVLSVGSALRTCGYQVRDFAVDVREGVVHSAVTCTVSLTADEQSMFADRLRQVPTVVSVEPC